MRVPSHHPPKETGGRHTGSHLDEGACDVALLHCVLNLAGWTVITALLLAMQRKPILGMRPPTALSRALTFVYAEYKPGFFW